MAIADWAAALICGITGGVALADLAWQWIVADFAQLLDT
jgi:hypothetical protein